MGEPGWPSKPSFRGQVSFAASQVAQAGLLTAGHHELIASPRARVVAAQQGRQAASSEAIRLARAIEPSMAIEAHSVHRNQSPRLCFLDSTHRTPDHATHRTRPTALVGTVGASTPDFHSR